MPKEKASLPKPVEEKLDPEEQAQVLQELRRKKTNQALQEVQAILNKYGLEFRVRHIIELSPKPKPVK